MCVYGDGGDLGVLMGKIQLYLGKTATLDEQEVLIQRAIGPRGRAWPPLTSRGFDVLPVPNRVFDSLRDRLATTWHAGRLYFEPEWHSPAASIDDGQILHKSWIQPDGSLKPNRSTLSWVNGHDPSYKTLLTRLLPLHEEWAGIPLEPTEAYGPRVYLEGSVLARHVDRTDTHVVASTITIEASGKRPWPFVIEDHEGQTHAIDLLPGEMAIFESSRLPHCRPESLSGGEYISLFLHYRPAGSV
jgi:hypothetical protein